MSLLVMIYISCSFKHTIKPFNDSKYKCSYEYWRYLHFPPSCFIWAILALTCLLQTLQLLHVIVIKCTSVYTSRLFGSSALWCVLSALNLKSAVFFALLPHSLINQDYRNWFNSKTQGVLSVLIYIFLVFRVRWSQPVQTTHYICGISVRGGRLSCIRSNSTERGKHKFH